MNIEQLIKILQKCNPSDQVLFFRDDEFFNISHVEQSITDKSVYLYQSEPNFTGQSEDRNIELVVHSVDLLEGGAQFIKTSHTECQEQKYQREIVDAYVGEAILDRYVDPEELRGEE